VSDLTTTEQTNVRTALKFLRSRAGRWEAVAKALHIGESTAANVAAGQTVTASLAMRIAKLAKVGVDDVLTGRFPAPGTCPHCGHRPEETTQ
jgi:hypothetical protein